MSGDTSFVAAAKVAFGSNRCIRGPADSRPFRSEIDHFGLQARDWGIADQNSAAVAPTLMGIMGRTWSFPVAPFGTAMIGRYGRKML